MGGYWGIWIITLFFLVSCSSSPTGEVTSEPMQEIVQETTPVAEPVVEEVEAPPPAPEPVANTWKDLSKQSLSNCNEPRPSSCSFNKEFVCGSDGKTYKNSCAACMNENVEWVVNGAC